MDINAISARVIILATKPSPGLNSARKGTPKISATSPASIVDSNRELFLPFYRQKYADFTLYESTTEPDPYWRTLHSVFLSCTSVCLSLVPFSPMTATSGATIVTLAALATTAALRLILRLDSRVLHVSSCLSALCLRVQLPLSRH